jgi:hypothetical protein
MDDEALQTIIDEMVTLLAPVVDAAEDPVKLQQLMTDLGWSPASPPTALLSLADAGADLVESIGAEDGDGFDSSRLLQDIARIVSAINAIAASSDGDLPGGIDKAIFKSTIARDLLDYLLVEYLLGTRGTIGTILKLAGLIQLTPVAAAGTRAAYLKRSVQWDDIGRLFTNPVQGFQEVYAWNTAAPQLSGALTDLTQLMDRLGLDISFSLVDGALATFVNAGAPPPDPPVAAKFELAKLFDVPDGVSAGVQLLLRPPTADRALAFAILPYAQLQGATTIPLTDSFALTIGGNANFTGGVALTFAPGSDPQASTGFLAGAATAPAEIDFGVTTTPPDDGTEQILLGSEDGSRLAIKSMGVSLGVKVLDPQRIDTFVRFALDNAHVVVDPGDGESDSFLSKILPEGGLDIAFSTAMRVSSLGGFQFEGSGGLQIKLPLHIQLGPVDIQGLAVEAKPVDRGMQFMVGASVSGVLGPIEAAIDGAGLILTVDFVDPPNGNLGPIDLAFGFKPPNGVGLAIDAGVVVGGGYLYIDTDRGQYAGALELVVAEWLNLTAIGLISTKMPDGSPGFSLLVIITATFGSGLQLGYGFILIGVGGLLGVNRSMLFQPLMDGVRTGAINGILFPTDVIANAPKIISDLEAIFPAKQNTFLVGPMAKLSWAELITITLGVIIEIPPGDVAILGVLQLVLPDEDDTVLLLQVNFAGALEFSKKRLYFFASIYDSRILFITLQGEMGLLVDYSDQPNFVVTVGGFHPQFNPPPLPFPLPNRVQLNILNEDYARISVDTYFAVTTNTAQVGAHAQLFFGYSSVSINGQMGFDALFQFSPFHFTVEVTTAVAATVAGVGLFSIDIDITLEGTSPWHVHGKGSLTFLFFSVSVPIDKTWGDAITTTLPPVAVIPLLTGELGKIANWRAQLPAGSNLLVTLRQLDPNDPTLVLHPVGSLQISQRTVPLDLTLDKIGEQVPSDANHFQLGANSAGLTVTRTLQEPFAPAQFRDFTDAQKLSQAAYAPQDSGLELSATGTTLASGTAVTRSVRYELTVLDKQYLQFRQDLFDFNGALFGHFVAGASVSRSPLSAARRTQLQPLTQKVVLPNDLFAVANLADNTPYSAASVGWSSRASAQDYLNRVVRADPTLRDTLHILGQYELAP